KTIKITRTLCNQWMLIANKQKKQIFIGRSEDDYLGVGAIIGGSENHLLFINYREKNIDVFNLKTLQYMNKVILPIGSVMKYHCFIAKTEHDVTITDTNQRIWEMLLFSQNTGLSIEYDEDSNTFRFRNVRVCTSIKQCYSYGCVYVNHLLLFFGGEGTNGKASDRVYKYSFLDKQWMNFEQTLPISLNECTAILNEDHTFVHILGGYDGNTT
ncbi:hypothetical protein RFI_31719, partial [Reticulomyxa filosa]